MQTSYRRLAGAKAFEEASGRCSICGRYLRLHCPGPYGHHLAPGALLHAVHHVCVHSSTAFAISTPNASSSSFTTTTMSLFFAALHRRLVFSGQYASTMVNTGRSLCTVENLLAHYHSRKELHLLHLYALVPTYFIPLPSARTRQQEKLDTNCHFYFS